MEKTNKEKLTETLDYMNEEQCLFIENFIKMFSNGHWGKGDLMELCDMHGTGKVDSALPVDYVRRIQAILPSFRTAFHVMDYRDQSFGAINNIAETLVFKAFETFKDK